MGNRWPCNAFATVLVDVFVVILILPGMAMLSALESLLTIFCGSFAIGYVVVVLTFSCSPQKWRSCLQWEVSWRSFAIPSPLIVSLLFFSSSVQGWLSCLLSESLWQSFSPFVIGYVVVVHFSHRKLSPEMAILSAMGSFFTIFCKSFAISCIVVVGDPVWSGKVPYITILSGSFGSSYVAIKYHCACSHLLILSPGMAILSAVGSFLTIFCGSFAIGCVVGCVCAFLTKFTKIAEYPLLETSLVVLMSYR